MKYFIILLFIFTSVFPVISNFLGISIRFSILFSGFILYFILGYYLHTFLINKKLKISIYILGIIGFLFAFLATIFYSKHLNVPNEYFLSYLTFGVVLFSTAVFLFFKNIKIKSKKVTDVITFLGKNYFGIYLVHGLVIGLLKKIGLFDVNIPLCILIFILAIIVFIASLAITYLASKIPVIKKLIKIG